jgi:peptidyl-tRNA hydrolase, PTH1 family
MTSTMIRLFVGLGNPGAEYEATRHNAGFWWVDALADKLGVRLVPERAYQGIVARANLPGGPVWLLEPMTFMNRSGASVAPLARFFKIEPKQILVVHDELDLLPGQAKLRLGIGHPGVKAEVVNYVLKKPSPDHRDAIGKAMDQSLSASDALIAGDMDKALALIHAGAQRPKPPRPAPAPTPSPESGGPK